MKNPDQCPKCGVLCAIETHSCIEYDPNQPCPTCSAPSVYAWAAAPGTGGCWSCKNGHRWGNTMRELTIEEII